MPSPSSAASPAPKKRKGFLRRLFGFLITIVFLLIVIAVAVPFLVPAEKYKGVIMARATQALGRELRIEGPVSFTILPRLAVKLEGVSLAGSASGEGKDLATVKKLEAVVALWPLIEGDIQVERFVLTEPVISLETDRNGKPNWEFAPGKKEGASVPVQETSGTRQSGGSAVAALSVGSFEIIDGQLSMTDARKNSFHLLTDMNVNFSLPGLDRPAKFRIAATWDKKQIRGEGEIGQPRSLMEDRSSPAELKISVGDGKVVFRGTLESPKSRPAVSGQLEAEGEDLIRLATMAAADKPSPVTGFRLSSAVKANRDDVSLSGLSLEANDTSATGDLKIHLAGARPKVTGALKTSVLDLDKLMASAGETGKSAESSVRLVSQAHAAPASAAGWSNEPLDLSGLKSVDADLKVSLDGVVIKKAQTGPTVLDIALVNGNLDTSFPETRIFDGKIAGTLGLDASGTTPAVTLETTMGGIQVEQLLRAFADFKRLTGTGEGKMSVRTSGKSQRDMVGNLDGKGNFMVRDGAIRGINIAAMARNIGSAFQAGSDAEKTDFAELSSDFTITNGVVNSTLQMMAPVLRVTGAGQISLVPKTVNYRLEPKLVGTLQGQGGKTDLGGLTVPVVVSGTFDRLSFAPDLSGTVQQIMQDPKGALDQLKSLKDQLKKGTLFAPGEPAPGAQPAPETQTAPAEPAPQQPEDPKKQLENQAKDLLKGFLGGQKK
ncbi:MAG: AsmA family protein [Pseudomonadota bacterium]|nr:AsmA family protein [Pseudomonadota bacterium]